MNLIFVVFSPLVVKLIFIYVPYEYLPISRKESSNNWSNRYDFYLFTRPGKIAIHFF